ncbi:MAG: two-component regulator propeller domain-containing protein [Flavobacteriaceae bacterium]
MRKFLSFYYLFIFCLILSFSSYAQQVVRIDNEEGLLNGIINTFEKDSLGYFWIGSDKGLNRYSDLEIKNYDLENIISVQGTSIIEILNFDGVLYMISPNGYLIKYDYEYEHFDKILQEEGKRFLSIARLDNERLIIGLDYGFLIYNIKTKKTSKLLQPETFINREVLVFKNKIFVASGKGCYIYSFDKDLDALSLQEILLEQKDVISIAIDSKERLWIGTETEGLFIKNGPELKPIYIEELQQKTYAIRKIEFDKQNNALVAVDRLGLLVIDEYLKINQIFSHDLDEINTISQNSIYEIYVDNYNTYWLGLREGGINIIYEKDNVFKQLSHVLNDPNSINDNTIRAIFEDENGDLWFGTENGLSKFSDQKFTNYNKKLFLTIIYGFPLVMTGH